MKKIFYLLPIILILALQTFAFQMKGDSKIKYNNNSDEDLFLFGGDIILNGDTEGNCYIFGGDVTVNGRINEDLYAFCGDFNLNGTVNENLYAFGGNIVVSGNVYKDINAFGGQIVIDSSAVCYGDLNVKGGKVYINGTVSGEVEIEAKYVEINGIINNDAKINTGKLVISDLATITGDLEHSDKDLDMDSITIRGKSDFRKFHTRDHGTFKAHFKFFLVSLIFGIIWFYLFPKSFNKTGNTLKDHTGNVAVWGLLYLLAVPILAIIAMIFIITIPFTVIYLVIYGLFIFMGQFVLANWIGNLISTKFPSYDKWLLPFISGLLMIHILINIPIIRGFTMLTWIFLGTATIWYNIFNNRERKLKLQPVEIAESKDTIQIKE